MYVSGNEVGGKSIRKLCMGFGITTATWLREMNVDSGKYAKADLDIVNEQCEREYIPVALLANIWTYWFDVGEQKSSL